MAYTTHTDDPTSPGAADEQRSACSYVIGDDGLSHWSETHSDAWIGLMETHKSLLRVLNRELEAEHGLSVSSLELLGRLAAAEGRLLGLSILAEQAGLSLSRVSRLLDALAERGFVQRRPCPGDGRAKNAWLTDSGLDFVRSSQAVHFASVQRHFFDHLEPDEVAVLARVFARFAPGASGNCTG